MTNEDYIKAHDIAKRVEKEGKGIITHDEKRFAEKVYKDLNNGTPFRGCTNCWADLIILTSIKINHNNNNSKNTIMGKFKLNEKKVIQVHGFEPIGAKNLTDEKALALLKTHKGHIKSFESYPENWEALVDAYVVPVVKASASTPSAKSAAATDKGKATDGEEGKDNAGTADDNNDGALEGKSKADAAKEDKAASKEKLEGMSKKELTEVCVASQYPEKEYKGMGQAKLVAYIMGKLYPSK